MKCSALFCERFQCTIAPTPAGWISIIDKKMLSEDEMKDNWLR